MDSSDIRIRVGTADDWDAISDLLGYAFHETIDQETRDREASVFEPERSLVADDGGAVVGHAAAYTRELTVPGGPVPAAFVTLVGVAPTHRRQGLLGRMMRRQLAEVAEAGREPLAVLWASEGAIYPRYGYGLATQRLSLDVALREIRPAQAPMAPEARLRLIEPADATADLAKVYEQLRADRPGYASRDDRWWRAILADPASERNGATALHGAKRIPAAKLRLRGHGCAEVAVGDHALGQVVESLEALSAGDRQLARCEEVLERALLRLPTPHRPALALECAHRQRTFLGDAREHAPLHLPALRRAFAAPPVVVAQVEHAALEERIVLDREQAGLVRPVLEHPSFTQQARDVGLVVQPDP